MLSAQQFKKCRYHLNKPIGYISLVYTWRDTKLAKFSMIIVLQQHKNYENNSKRETCCIPLLDFYLVRADAELRVSQFGYSIDLCGPCLFLLLYNLLFSTKKTKQIFVSFCVKKRNAKMVRAAIKFTTEFRVATTRGYIPFRQ